MADIGIRILVSGAAEARRQIQGVDRDITRLGSTFGSVSGAVGALGSSLSRVGSAIAGIGTTLTVGVTLPLVALGTAAIGAGIKYEDAFAGILKTTDGLGNSWDTLTVEGQKLNNAIQQLALSVPITASELASIGEIAGQLGLRGADNIASFIDTIAQIGTATDLSFTDAADKIARFGNILGVTSDDLAGFAFNVGNSLVELGNNFATTESEVINLSTRIAGAFGAAGASASEILGLSAAVSQFGITAELGGTALSNLITDMDLAASTGGATAVAFDFVLRSVGEGAVGLADAMQNPVEAVLQLAQGLVTLQEKGQLTDDLLQVLGLSGSRALRVMEALGQNVDLARAAIAASNDEFERGAALQTEFDKRVQTINSRLKILKNNFLELGITIFDAFREDIIRIVDRIVTVIQNLTTAFKNLTPEGQKTVAIIVGIAAAIGPALTGIGLFVKAIGVGLSIISGLISPLGLVVGLIVLLGTVLVIKVGPDNIFEFLKTVVQGIPDAIQTIIDKINFLKDVASGEISLTVIVPTALKDDIQPIQDLFDDIRTLGEGGAIGEDSPIFGVSAALHDISLAIDDIVASLSGINFSTAFAGFKDAELDAASKALQGIAEIDWNFLALNATVLATQFTIFADAVASIAQIGIDSTFESMASSTSTLSGSFMAINDVLNILAPALNVIAGILLTLGTVIFGIVTIAISSFVIGISTAIQVAFGLIKAIVNLFVAFGRFVLGMDNARTALQEAGAGIETVFTALKDHVTRSFQLLADSVRLIAERLKFDLVGGSIFPDMKDAIIAVLGDLVTEGIAKFHALVDGILGVVSGIGEKVGGFLSTLFSGTGESSLPTIDFDPAAIIGGLDQVNAKIEEIKLNLLVLQESFVLMTTFVSATMLTLVTALTVAFTTITAAFLLMTTTMQATWALFSALFLVAVNLLVTTTILAFTNLQTRFMTVINNMMSDISRFTTHFGASMQIVVGIMIAVGTRAVIMKSIVSGALQDIIHVLDAASNAFRHFGQVALEVASQVAQAAASMAQSAAVVSNAWQGSPKLKIQHSFEDFLDFLTVSGPSISQLLQESFAPLTAQTLESGAAPSTITNNTTDNRVSIGQISGVPMDSPDQAADFVVQAAQRFRFS